MAIQKLQKISSASIVPGVRLSLNPFAQQIGSARVLRNWIPERNRMMRKPFPPKFHSPADTASGQVWDIIDFRFHRAGAFESQCLIFRSDGKVYKRTAGHETDIFPFLAGSVNALSSRPQPVQIGNFLIFGDTEAAYIYDGRTIRLWGIARETTAATVSAQGGGSLTAATGVTGTFTWAVLDEQSNRVHESSRSPVSTETALSSEDFRFDVSAFTAPTGATHWSAYMSVSDGSAVRRRVATTRITTTTVDISAFPSSSDSIEPSRNDPPPTSGVMTEWINRIAVRDDTDKKSIFFTAFGEVNGLSNGQGLESAPGFGADSISDLTNEFDFASRSTRALQEHENILFVMTENSGFVVIGTGGIIDSLGSRDLYRAKQFTVGCAGARAITSTPFGLPWMTQGRQIKLWPGGQELIDLGFDIQPQLNEIPEAELKNVTFKWWDGHGRQWLMVTVNAPDGEDLTGTPTNRILIFDFALRTSEERRGEWFEWTDITATVISEYIDGDQRFLLAGDSSGDVYQLDTICDPAHLNRSMILGETYLGSSIQNNPATTLRTGLILPNDDREAVGLYTSFVRGSQDGPSTSVGSDPTFTSAVDPIDPDDTPGISLTPDSAKDSGEAEVWLAPENGGDPSGAFGKQFQIQAAYSAGSSNNAEADGRTTVALEGLYKLAFAWQVGPERSE